MKHEVYAEVQKRAAKGESAAAVCRELGHSVYDYYNHTSSLKKKARKPRRSRSKPLVTTLSLPSAEAAPRPLWAFLGSQQAIAQLIGELHD